MRMKLVPAVLISVLSLSTAGCGYVFGDKGVFRDRSEDYKKSPETQPIKIPEGMDSAKLTEIYPIPNVQDTFVSESEFQVPRPVALSASAGSDVVRIQKLGEQSWALIGVAPGQVWPQVRNFMSASNMQIARAEAQAGIIESDWMTVDGQQGRFQFRMEQGVQRGTTELYVLQMRRTTTGDTWPAKSDDPAQATKMLQSIAQFLADSSESAPVSMIAEQGISAGGKITLQETEGHSYLQLDLPFDRAWASLDRALVKSTFEITDKDRSSGVFYVRFLGQAADEDKSWWSKLWSSDEAHAMVGREFQVSVHTLNEQSVRISLSPQGDSESFDKSDEQELLLKIKGNID